MGGSGSVRYWGGGGSTCENYHSIDIRTYARKGFLEPGSFFTTRWSRGGEETGAIGVRAGYDLVTLVYRTRSHDGYWKNVEQRIELCYTTPHYGGQRPWFSCPNCLRRCALLYGGSRFYCRKCWRLPYQSQREDRSGRLLQRVQAIRVKLGGSVSMFEPFPDKPKGMHWRTYDRLCSKAKAVENALNYATAEKWFPYLL